MSQFLLFAQSFLAAPDSRNDDPLNLALNSANLLQGGLDRSVACQQELTNGLALIDKLAEIGELIQNPPVTDVNNLYSWTSSAGDNLADGTAFTGYLATLSRGGSHDDSINTITGCFANHCDWRLPTIVELQGIVDLDQGSCTEAPARVSIRYLARP